MDEKLKQKVEKILDGGNIGYAYFYPSDGTDLQIFVFSMTPENIANFLGSHYLDAIIPDISEYSWDEIIEIRHHDYWTQFRKKLTELSESIGDIKQGQDILEEIVRKDLIEMAQRFRSQVTKNIVKGVASNIPLPIPINPISVVCTGYDIMKEIDFNKKYGWIYFYLDNKK